MGIDLRAAQFLVAAHREGVTFDKTLTLGHQWLMLSSSDLARIFSRLQAPAPANVPGLFADVFLRAIGAKELLSMDASAYENADIIHDLNLPITEHLKGQFDVVFDGGTMEHVFNYPQAVKNAMEMVKVGGRLMLYFPTNNWCGHGFYQFSPELIYRMLSANNGYKIEHMYANGHRKQWYSVIDPEEVHERVELSRERRTTFLLVQALRVEDKPIFRDTPQQSDYVAKWGSDIRYRQKALGRWIDSHFPEYVGTWLRIRKAALVNAWTHQGTLRYRKHFTPIKLPT